MNLLTVLFVVALAAGLAMEFWLMQRQARHVRAHADRVPPAFADRIEPEQHRKAAEYTQAQLQAGRCELGFGAVWLLLLTLGGGIALLDSLWSGSGLDPLWWGTALVLSVFFVLGLLDLPYDAWRTFGIESRFGFNRTTPARFVKDKLLGALLSLAIGGPLIAAVLWVMTAGGELWWLYAWLIWMAFTLTLSWAYPRVIAPLFNRFTALEAGPVRERLERLLERCGFRSDGMFVMDGSQRSSHGNAYFTGLGRSKRIVFFDTLLNALAPDELEAVLAHELGHFRRRHVIKRLALMAAITLLGLALLGWLRTQPWFYAGLGAPAATPAVALVLFLLVVPVFTQFLRPVGAWLSRRQEFEADEYAAAQADAGALIRALVKLYRDNASTLTPDPVYSAFHHSHPPAPVRIAHLEALQQGAST
jgi:STE24 endopeptidase